MPKKPSLRDPLNAALEMKNRGPAPTARLGGNEYKASAVNLRKGDWRLLRRVAEARSEAKGGRPSVSKVLESLIDASRAELTKEAE